MKNAILFLFFVTFACTNNQSETSELAERDYSITKENSFTELFIDTTTLATFLKKHPMEDSMSTKIQSFYNQRNYQYAWFFPDGMAEFVPAFLSLQNDYVNYSGDSSLYDSNFNILIDSLGRIKKINPKNPVIANTELLLTQKFFRYAGLAYSGDHRINTQELSWYIPRKKLNEIAFLDSLRRNKGKNLSEYEPVNRQYNLLKEKLLQYYQIERATKWDSLDASKKLSEGKKGSIIPEIKNRLALLGDLSVNDSTSIFDSTLTSAVKHFQGRMGQKQTGEMGPAFFRELNTPVHERIRQILINMERIRWMPATPTTDYILVNIPEFKMHVYENGKLTFDMVVVVGSEANNTVIFSGTLSQIVFSPYWHVPQSIVKKEVLPGIERNPNYLARHNMEWYKGGIRQRPGKSNSLGLVKFLFPNSYSIYFHDTPSKRHFGESQRAFSHGCIRLSEPQKLAEFLLRKDPSWTSEKIIEAMNKGTEKYVRLRGENEIPVYIGYFTSWIDEQGNINFRRDIYGHDKKMTERLFKNNLIVQR